MVPSTYHKTVVVVNAPSARVTEGVPINSTLSLISLSLEPWHLLNTTQLREAWHLAHLCEERISMVSPKLREAWLSSLSLSLSLSVLVRLTSWR